MGLARNGGHAIDIARQNNVSDEIILEEIYEIMTYIYGHYLIVINSRPEHQVEAFDGAVYFYKNYFKEVATQDYKLLTYKFWEQFLFCAENYPDEIQAQILTLTFPDFLNMCEMAISDKPCDSTDCNTCDFHYQENN